MRTAAASMTARAAFAPATRALKVRPALPRARARLGARDERTNERTKPFDAVSERPERKTIPFHSRRRRARASIRPTFHPVPPLPILPRRVASQARARARRLASRARPTTTTTAAVKEGDRVPEAVLQHFDSEGELRKVSTAELCGDGKTVVLFAVPGAFTPTCSLKHLPGFIKLADEMKDAGADDVVLRLRERRVRDAGPGRNQARSVRSPRAGWSPTRILEAGLRPKGVSLFYSPPAAPRFRSRRFASTDRSGENRRRESP